MIKTYLQTLRLFSRDARLYLMANSIASLSYVGIYVMLFNLYLLRLGYGPEFIGLINAGAQLGVAAFSLLAGMLGRRWGSRRMLIIGLSISTTGLSLIPLAEFVPSGWQATWLVVIYILSWQGGATYMVNSVPFVMSVTKPAERAHVFSMREALVPLALFAGNLIGGILPGFLAPLFGDTLLDPAPYRYALFVAAALFSLAPATLWATSKPESDASAQQRQAAPSGSASAPLGLMLFMGCVILLQLAGRGVIDTFFNVYLDVDLRLSPVWIGSLSATAQLLAVPLALLAPLLVMRWGKGGTIILGTLGMAASLLLLGLIPHWTGAGLGLMGIYALFAVTMPTFMLCSQELVSPEWQATMSGAMAMAMGLSRSVTAFGGGYLISGFGYSTLFLVAAGLTAGGAILFWAYTWLPRRYLLHQAAVETMS